MTPIRGWCGQYLSSTKPVGSDQSMAQAVVRHGIWERAMRLVPAAQATANGRMASGMVHTRNTWKATQTGNTQVAVA